MSIDDQELRALAFLALRVRKATNGAGPWDEPGLMANLRKLQTRNLHLTIEHVLRHAADPAAKSPGVLLGSFTPEAPKAGGGHWMPPKRDEECPKHPGKHRDSCGGCVADELAVEYDEPAPTPIKATGDATTWADRIRADLRAEVRGETA
jgi:hypothetical protein